MASLPMRLRALRPLLTPLQNSARALVTVPTPAPNSDTRPLPPTKIDEAYLSSAKVDIEAVFLSEHVQKLLRYLTCVDMKKVFAPRKKEFTPPQYKLLSDEQFKEEMEKAVRKTEVMTQMPPVLRKRKPCERVLRRDPELQELYTTKFIFTDISFGHQNRARPIVVREPDGTLRTASWEERERMLQTYFTDPSRQFETPAMFTEPHLTSILNKGRYIFVLDRACVQFEPNSEEYLGVTQRVFEHLNETGQFDVVRSTRHFGPMCFYFAVTKKCDPLLFEMLSTGRMDYAAKFVELLHAIHPTLKSAKDVNSESTPRQFVEAYIKWESQTKPAHELALQSCLELQALRASESKNPDDAVKATRKA